ncbi:unnamed protein product [Larinioides sclopetarius]|uniref:Reverse transcriptase domain-containing protein n=1 Tax=Larinioides sclopetarius TaxID=280406 RepID=A0AAV1YXW1_9ARAC
MAFRKSSPPTDLFTIANMPQTGHPKEAALKILQQLYPPTIEPNIHSSFTDQEIETEPPFTNKEIKEIFRTLPTNKAPGKDGIDYIILKEIQKAFPALLRKFLNKCLQLHHFPTPLKDGIIVLFHKEGKEERNISSYRPITLLPTLGKVLEKLLQRINYKLEKDNLLHPNQFGFRQGKSVDLALHTLIAKIQEAKNNNLHSYFLSIDIKGAFDNLIHSSIRNALDNLISKTNITETIKSILQNRTVSLSTQTGPVQWKQTKGCPQGSCSGPFFWNLIANNILKETWPENIHLHAFADDFAFLITHKTQQGARNLAKTAIEKFSQWANNSQLSISTEKTKYIYFGKSINPPRLKWLNERITKVQTIKYLGVHIDEKLNFIHHIQEKGTQALQQYQQLQRIAGKDWGISNKDRILIYKTVTERTLSHGAVVWAQHLTARAVRKLLTIQRKFLLTITRAYHTTATSSLQILTGIPPLNLSVEKEANFIKLSRFRKSITISGNTIHPEEFEEQKIGHEVHPAKFNLDSHKSQQKNYKIIQQETRLSQTAPKQM